MSDEWHYYLLSFGFNGPRVNMPGDFPQSQDASAATFSAEDRVEQQAREANLEMRHAYAWPDGSLYKYVRLKKEMRTSDFDEIFCDLKDHREGKPFISSDGRRVHRPMVSVNGCDKQNPKRVSQIFPFISLEEKFTINSNEDLMALSNKRSKQREECFSTYHKHREECPKCPKPHGFPCKEGSKLCTEAQEAAHKFIEQLNT